jgi:putative transposase
VNHKRIWRLYKQAGLSVRKRRKTKRVAVERQSLACSRRPNEVWSADFVMDALSNGRCIKCLTVVDDFSRECVELAVDHGMGGEYVTRLLDRAAHHGVQHLLNEAGCPTQNAYIESFNGKFRDECLNEQWFRTLAQARQEIARWRRDYNEVRPHSSVGRIPPAQFAALHRPMCCNLNLGLWLSVVRQMGAGQCNILTAAGS